MLADYGHGDPSFVGVAGLVRALCAARRATHGLRNPLPSLRSEPGTMNGILDFLSQASMTQTFGESRPPGDTSAPVNPAILVLADASVSMKTRRSARWNIRWKPY